MLSSATPSTSSVSRPITVYGELPSMSEFGAGGYNEKSNSTVSAGDKAKKREGAGKGTAKEDDEFVNGLGFEI